MGELSSSQVLSREGRKKNGQADQQQLKWTKYNDLLRTCRSRPRKLFGVQKVNFLLLPEQTSEVGAHTSCMGLGELSSSLEFFSLRHCNEEVSIITPSLQWGKWGRRRRGESAKYAAWSSYKHFQAAFILSCKKKESFMLPRRTYHPNFIYLVHQQQTLQCHQILLIFSESYGLKGWVKCFPKSSECTKKGGKK